jgi:hypothetical protein
MHRQTHIKCLRFVVLKPKSRDIYTGCPTCYRTRHFFNNSNTNEDIAKKFEQGYVRFVRNEEECVCSAPNCCDTEQRSARQPAGFGSEWNILYNFSACSARILSKYSNIPLSALSLPFSLAIQLRLLHPNSAHQVRCAVCVSCTQDWRHRRLCSGNR